MSRFARFVGLSAGLCASTALAQDVPEEPVISTAVRMSLPATYEAAVLAGTRKIVVRDFDGAIVALREAATSEGSRPEAFCRLGDAQLAAGVLEEARAAFETCARFAGTELTSHQLAVALVGLARVTERENKPKDERYAWQRVLSATRDAVAVNLAQGRLLVLDALLAQESAQAQVRARIAERAAENAAAKP